MTNIVDLFGGHVAKNQNRERLARMMPIATLIYDGGGCDGLLALLMDQREKYERIIEVEYGKEYGLSEGDGAIAICSMVELLAELCE